MAELTPLPFPKLVSRLLRELHLRDAVFDLPRRSFFLGDPGKDLSVRFHGLRAATPLGPAAGPHTQMAQNIALAWLAGCRIFELKTVQVLDRLKVPRPCIDMRTLGFNVEWSQELRLEQSLEEYVKASMLIRILREKLGLGPAFADLVLDMSVGYDLQGIRGERVQAFIDGMRDASPIVDRLRRELPRELGALRDLDFETKLSRSVTVSTFHGCPPEEIEGIASFLLEKKGLHCVLKLNPTLLGAETVRETLGRLGFPLKVPDEAFQKDPAWEQAAAFIERLSRRARDLGAGFGVKLTNTLIVENDDGGLPRSEKVKYLSGAPLHVLAMRLVRELRRRFADSVPVSFSAGVDRLNFPDAVSLGLVPVTACTDFLKPGGYGRARGFLDELRKRMDAAGACDIPSFILDARGLSDEARIRAGLLEEPEPGTVDHADWVAEAKLLNTEDYVQRASEEPRYARPALSKPPRKVGTRLGLFDCLSCAKCVPVCPNDANFAYRIEPQDLPTTRLTSSDGGFAAAAGAPVRIAKPLQFAGFADFCNECGNCGTFCPEDGGPYLAKPRFFGSLEAWQGARELDGFYFERRPEGRRMFGRFDGKEYVAVVEGPEARYSGEGFDLRFDPKDPAPTAVGFVQGEAELVFFYVMDALARALLAPDAVSWVNP